jgi:aminopeptidase YwaD
MVGRARLARRRRCPRLQLRRAASAFLRVMLGQVAVIASIAVLATRLHAQSPIHSAIPLAGKFFSLVRPGISGDTAFDITAFVEQRWRLPGNRGFDESLDRVVATLRAAGYTLEREAGAGNRLTYRVETYPMEDPAWEPDSASLQIVGEPAPVLRFSTNRNMVAIGSSSTAPAGVEGELVLWNSLADTASAPSDLSGRIVLADVPIEPLFAEAVQKRHAAGVLSYGLPEYTRPEVNRTSIQFGRVPRDSARRSFGLLLSRDARDRLHAALARGTARVRVTVAARSWSSVERTVVAEARGRVAPDERFVFSAHVQEPGANDNASGTGALADMARMLATLVRDRRADPGRTITMIWGNEIGATQRYLQQDSSRTRGVRWGMALDMVGENTTVTGGTFLIEKMPDPSAVWTRGEDRHTAWGGSPMAAKDIRPHYFNDFVINRCRDLGAATRWHVDSNPFEGGSDHVPFLGANKPGVLLWHFTDQFYHTDNDRLDKVSRSELANSSVCALVVALTLTSADESTAKAVVREVESAATRRLNAEFELSRKAIAAGANRANESQIVSTWGAYYRDAIGTVVELEANGPSVGTRREIKAAAARVDAMARDRVRRLP